MIPIQDLFETHLMVTDLDRTQPHGFWKRLSVPQAA
jgi:hypothetical protein